MKSIKNILYFLLVSIMLFSCKEDDDIAVPDIVIKDRGEQQIEDRELLIEYLTSHYYNSEFFLSGSNHKYTDIVVTELGEDGVVPAGHTLLMEAVETHTTNYQDTDYEYYILRLNQGGGKSPKFTDQVRVRYEGALLETGESFDGVVTPIDLLMQGVGASGGVIRGWQLVLPMFNTGFIQGINNGIVEYNDYGLGMMFLPSGLAYFSDTASGTLDPYSNLIFKFELLQYEEVDHDGDGIPSYVEDLDLNIDVLDDDTDEDLAPNYIDVDDDNDGVNTINELIPNTYTVDTNVNEEEPVLGEGEYEVSRSEANGIITINTVKIVDSDNNGVADYLQEDIAMNYNEEEEG